VIPNANTGKLLARRHPSRAWGNIAAKDKNT